MFCPACKKSFPGAAEICPECQGNLTSVIQISIHDPPEEEAQKTKDEAPPPPEPKTTGAEPGEESPPVPVPPISPATPRSRHDNEVVIMESSVRPAAPNLWMASTVLCMVLLFVVVFFDSSDSAGDARPAGTPTTAAPQLQAEEPVEKEVASTPEPDPETTEATPQDMKVRAGELLAGARSNRQRSAWQEAERDAEEAHRLYRQFGGTNTELAGSLEELARIHIGMNRAVKAETELKQAQRLNYSKERETLLASLIPQPVVPQPAPVKKKRPSLGGPSSVPQAAPRVPQAKPRTQARERPRMKEIEAYKKSEDEEGVSEVPLGQQNVVEGYRTTRRTGRSGVPGY